MSETYTVEQLKEWLRRAAEHLGQQPLRLVVAYSGGRDSSVLLHAVGSCGFDYPLLALHVDHGLQAASSEWAVHCRQQSEAWGIECKVLPVEVALEPGNSVEALARDARYRALRGALAPGDWLLLAQHADDQAETFLLQLMRGAASRGLSAMPQWRELNGVFELRPLLHVSRAALSAYSEAHQLEVIEDPHNRDPRFDRVFVREQLLPQLIERWPQVISRLGATSEQMAVDAGLVATLARSDLYAGTDSQGRLSLAQFSRLSRDRQCALLREWLAEVGELMPPRRRLLSFLDALHSSRQDHQAELKLESHVIRHFQKRLYRVAVTENDCPDAPICLRLSETCELGPALGRLSLRPDSTAATVFVPPEGLSLRLRRGGERVQVSAGAGRRAVKDLLREAGIVPWMRDQIPLLFAGDTLIAVGDLWLASHGADKPNARLEWADRPALF